MLLWSIVESARTWDGKGCDRAMSDIYPMFIEHMFNRVSSGFSGYIWLDTKIVLKALESKDVSNYVSRFDIIKTFADLIIMIGQTFFDSPMP